MKKVLLVEDDPNLGMLLQEFLQLKGDFDVTFCTNGEEGLIKFTKDKFDICVFDIMMPNKDGLSLAEDIRKIDKEIPIIFATAKGLMEDKAKAFNLGGDDYIIKPFKIEELLLRINALLKRYDYGKKEMEPEKTEYQIGDYFFNYNNFTLTYNNIPQKLSTKEAELLKLLCLKMNNVLKREEALIRIWNEDTYFNGRSMDVFLSKLRKYLIKDENIKIINIHSKGYKLLVEEA